MDISAWLRGLGLERYETAFRDNEIDWSLLPKLTADDLKDIGVTASATAAGCSMPSPSYATPSLTLPRWRGREGWGWMPSGGSSR